jgi:hypothetical protein
MEFRVLHLLLAPRTWHARPWRPGPGETNRGARRCRSVRVPALWSGVTSFLFRLTRFDRENLQKLELRCSKV